MSLSSSIEREINEYQDVSSGSEGSEDSVDSLSCNDSSDEHYSSGVPGIPLKEFQELQRRMASGFGASSSRQPSSPPQDEEKDEEDIIYSCAPEVASTLDAAKLKNLVASPRFPLNSFCRDLFHRLGIGPNQLNPNG